MQRSQVLRTWQEPTPEASATPPRVQWSPVREAERLVERHEKLLALEYSRAGWKTAQMVEERMHAIADRLLTASTEYPSLRALLDRRDLLPAFDLGRNPDLAAVVTIFNYFEVLRHPADPRRAAASP
jgi:hypothetical protein